MLFGAACNPIEPAQRLAADILVRQPYSAGQDAERHDGGEHDRETPPHEGAPSVAFHPHTKPRSLACYWVTRPESSGVATVRRRGVSQKQRWARATSQLTP